jgi:leucyl aminopeptidase
MVREVDGSKTLEIGIGKRSKITTRKLRLLARQVIRVARDRKLEKIALEVKDLEFPELAAELSDSALGELLAQNFGMANYEFKPFKTPRKKSYTGVKEVVIVGEVNQEWMRGVERGQIIAGEINACRDLCNTPGGDMTPKILADKAREAVKDLNIKVEVLGKKEMKELGMGAVLGVASGSSEEPQFIIMEYFGAKDKDERPVVFAGKGVTFDTGGLNLKPEQGINEMHMDMSGGAAVIHAVALAARLKLKKNVVGLIPAVENMPSGSSYRPGDILKSLSGKTIEVLNTDAEGRIILADALFYAGRYNPRFVADVATLTGASLTALGEHASAIMTKDQATEDRLRELGEESGDYVWPFPLWEEYNDMVKGRFGDVPNIPVEGNSRYAGVIGGGMFLLQFTGKYPKDCPFVHIDMAPKMTAARGEHLAKGATGAPIGLLLKIIEEF